MDIKKKILISLSIVLIVVLSIVFGCHRLVVNHSESYHSSDIAQIPHCKVGLVLGTVKVLAHGRENLYFTFRIDAAEQLLKQHVIDKIIVSGDNSRKGYDEPTDMRQALIERGIDSNRIVMDYAGFRTFDSMKRLKEVFGQQKVIVVSQKFHNQRAIYIGQKLGIQTYGYDARDVNQYSGFKTNLREYFARVKVVLDFIIGVEPKFLGEKVVI